MTGRQVASDQLVWCRGIGTAESFTMAEMRLVCPLVTAEVQVALVEDLPVLGMDFLLGNDLSGEKVWVGST